MTSAPNTPPDIFDTRLALLRAKRGLARRQRHARSHFLLHRIAEDCAERILDVNRNFSRVLILAEPEFYEHLRSLLPPEKLAVIDIRSDMFADDLSLPEARYDLIISILQLHRVNDLPGALTQIRRALVPDGLFIGAVFGGATLSPLRQMFYTVDQDQIGGVSPRVSPMIDMSQAAAMLQRVGLKLPVVDIDKVKVTYRTLKSLIQDLRDMGETNILTARQTQPLSRRYITHLTSEFIANDQKTGRVTMPFDILWMTGWAEHPDQQKPLKPGSAKTRLADALGVTETKL